MSDHDSFEDRLRAMADQVSDSIRRISDEVDVDKLAERYGLDADRARNLADAASQWLTDRVSDAEPLFGPPAHRESREPTGPGSGGVEAYGSVMEKSGPHPLDLPTEPQGRALSALDSGRWTVGAGSNRLTSGGEGPPPPAAAADLVGELRARDWITADGTLTLTGRHALGRWCRTAGDPALQPPEPDAPPAA